MDTNAKRERLKAIVLEQQEVRGEIERLRVRSAQLDAELDRLLSSGTTSAKTEKEAGKAAPAPARKPVRRGRAKAAKNAQKGQKARKAEPARKPAAEATPKKRAPVEKAQGPTLKEKIVAALRGAPEGLDVGVIAKEVYGSDDPINRRKCEQNLYNMARKKLVRHHGPKWQVLAGK